MCPSSQQFAAVRAAKVATLANGAVLTADDELDLVFCPHSADDACVIVDGVVHTLVVLTTKRLLAMGHSLRDDNTLPWCIDATYKVCPRHPSPHSRRNTQSNTLVSCRPTRSATPC